MLVTQHDFRGQTIKWGKTSCPEFSDMPKSSDLKISKAFCSETPMQKITPELPNLTLSSDRIPSADLFWRCAIKDPNLSTHLDDPWKGSVALKMFDSSYHVCPFDSVYNILYNIKSIQYMHTSHATFKSYKGSHIKDDIKRSLLSKRSI